MLQCEFCNRESDELDLYTDVDGKVYNICKDCADKVQSGICVRCGSKRGLAYKGLCNNCLQLKIASEIESEDEIDTDYEDDDTDTDDIIEMTDQQYMDWMTSGVMDLPLVESDSKYSMRVWLIAKLLYSGITDGTTIGENIADLEALAEKHMKIKRNCKFLITDSECSDTKVIDKLNKVYLIEA